MRYHPTEDIGDAYTFFFQHEEIEKVLHFGYHSPYEEKMQGLLGAG